MTYRAFSTIVPRLAVIMLPGWLALGCAGYETVDGYDATYVEPPPPEVAVTPAYRFRDGYIYESHGRYYHQHAGRWVAYRSLPREAVPMRAEGRTMWQRR